MSLDWSNPNPINFDSVFSLFSDCHSIDDAKICARRLMKKYQPENLVGNEPYTKENCLELWQILDEIVTNFDALQRSNSVAVSINSKRPQFINYAKYRKSFTLKNWDEFWQPDQPYGANVRRLLSYFVAVPDSAIQIPIIAAFCCQNTALLNISNTLFLYSRKAGSGKSTIAEIISALQGTLKNDDDDPDGMSQTGTYVSIRNFIAHNRIVRSDEGYPILDKDTRKPLEKNLFLVLDDFPKGKLDDEDFYNILKAYKRQNAYIRKAEKKKDENGDWIDTTVSFHVFCCKVLTACYQIFGIAEYQELTRRCLFIKCQPFEDIQLETESDERFMLENPLFNGDELFKASEINWNGILDEYYIAWNEQAVNTYQDACKRLRKPKSVSTARWEISKSIAASGYTLGVWESINEAYEAIKTYWEWFDTQKLDSKSGIELVLEDAIKNWIEACDSEFENCEYLPNGEKNIFYPMEKESIHPEWIDVYLRRAKKNSELDRDPTTKIRNEIMFNLGYKFRRIQGKNYYCSLD